MQVFFSLHSQTRYISLFAPNLEKSKNITQLRLKPYNSKTNPEMYRKTCKNLNKQIITLPNDVLSMKFLSFQYILTLFSIFQQNFSTDIKVHGKLSPLYLISILHSTEFYSFLSNRSFQDFIIGCCFKSVMQRINAYEGVDMNDYDQTDNNNCHPN